MGHPKRHPHTAGVVTKDTTTERTFFLDKGARVSSNADVRTFWSKKIRICFKIYGMSARTRGKEGWASTDILRTKKESIFRDFVRTSFMD